MSSSALSLLNGYDPTNPSSLSNALSAAGISSSYYTQGVNGTAPYDPGAQSPTAATTTVPANTSPGLNLYQQSLASLQTWSAQTLIESALFGGGSSGVAQTALLSALDNAAQAQQSQQAAQRQAALNAAQAALNAGTNVNTTA